MRDYGKVSPQFWIGSTGKDLRSAGMEAQIVAMYLMTSPHANMLGLYYMPKLYIAHETGLGEKGASKGLARAIEAGFCAYDEASEMVWVFEMARYQIADQLKPDDKRCVGIQNEYNALPANPHLGPFFDKYEASFNLTRKRQESSKTISPIEAPSKPHRSQEQEQEQEQNKNTSSARADMPAGFVRFWAAWPKSVRKVAKAACEKRWRSRGLEVQAVAIVAHVEAMRESRQWRDGYEPAPLTYLSQERWRDGDGADQPRDWWLRLGYGSEELARRDGKSAAVAA